MEDTDKEEVKRCREIGAGSVRLGRPSVASFVFEEELELLKLELEEEMVEVEEEVWAFVPVTRNEVRIGCMMFVRGKSVDGR